MKYILSSPFFWLSLSLLCIIIEILTPGFLFAAFALAALIAGICAVLIKNYYILISIFALTALISYFALKPWYSILILKSFPKHNKFGFQALVGKIGFITQSIQEGKTGYIKIDGDEWQACSKKQIEVGQKAIIVELEGNRVWVDEI